MHRIKIPKSHSRIDLMTSILILSFRNLKVVDPILTSTNIDLSGDYSDPLLLFLLLIAG